MASTSVKRLLAIAGTIWLLMTGACSQSEETGVKYSCNRETWSEIIEQHELIDASYGKFSTYPINRKQLGEKYVEDLLNFREYLRGLYAPEVMNEVVEYREAIVDFADALNTNIKAGVVEGLLKQWVEMSDARRDFETAFAVECAINSREG